MPEPRSEQWPVDPDAKPGQRGYMSRYKSPHGRENGIADRLIEHVRILGTDRTKPWVGMGLIDDLRKAAEMLGGPKCGLPLTEARAEVFASLAAADGPTGQRVPAQPAAAAAEEPEEWEKALAAPVEEYDL